MARRQWRILGIYHEGVRVIFRTRSREGLHPTTTRPTYIHTNYTVF